MDKSVDNNFIKWVPLTDFGAYMHFTPTLALGSAFAPSRETDTQTLGQRAQQRMVKDEVVFAPPRDPYLALVQASRRLVEGKSVFFTCRQADRAGD